MIGSLLDSIESDYGVIATRLYRAFRPQPSKFPDDQQPVVTLFSWIHSKIEKISLNSIFNWPQIITKLNQNFTKTDQKLLNKPIRY